MGDLNRTYTATPALWERDSVPEGFAWVEADAAEDNVFAFLRYAQDGSPLLAVSNFSPVVRHGYRIGVPGQVPSWREVINTDDERYGGAAGCATPNRCAPSRYRPRGARRACG
ncbi:hypothetical protein GCM10020254_29660 [Streptomyces goshikiensis]